MCMCLDGFMLYSVALYMCPFGGDIVPFKA